MTEASPPFDAVVVVSFGGPEGMDDVMPFLENVARGRNIPRQRLLETAEHYYEFGGKSPINEQNRALIAALVAELNRHGPRLPVYWGNRNWHPFLSDTLADMAGDGVRRALAFVTSAFSSYSSCRQYLEDIERARNPLGEAAPIVEKIRPFYNHPGFIESVTDRARTALWQVAPERRDAAALVFTAHSIPLSMAESCRYEAQLKEASRLVAEGLGRSQWSLAYQSRSGPPGQKWLEPDVVDRLRELRSAGTTDAVVVPIGFVSDHLEVVHDLDTVAAAACKKIGLAMVRAGTVGTHPKFVTMIRELIEERVSGGPKRFRGELGPLPDACPADCCPGPRRS
ncbi:MAG: ferrochelatase [Planctomycetia bacterium]|nr:ferrochelatase [Planctomycetia bacterium]